MNGGDKFKNERFAVHPDGRIAMRSCRFPVDPWEDSIGLHHSDTGMNKVGFNPVPDAAEAWDKGFDAGESDAMDNLATDDHECTPNPYRKEG